MQRDLSPILRLGHLPARNSSPMLHLSTRVCLASRTCTLSRLRQYPTPAKLPDHYMSTRPLLTEKHRLVKRPRLLPPPSTLSGRAVFPSLAFRPLPRPIDLRPPKSLSPSRLLRCPYSPLICHPSILMPTGDISKAW